MTFQYLSAMIYWGRKITFLFNLTIRQTLQLLQYTFNNKTNKSKYESRKSKQKRFEKNEMGSMRAFLFLPADIKSKYKSSSFRKTQWICFLFATLVEEIEVTTVFVFQKRNRHPESRPSSDCQITWFSRKRDDGEKLKKVRRFLTYFSAFLRYAHPSKS